LATGWLKLEKRGNGHKKVEPGRLHFTYCGNELFGVGALAAFARTRFAMFVVLGARFTAIVLAVTRDRMFAQFA
jgi:hypothetical protein